MAAKQGFLMYYSKGDAIGTKVSVRYRRSGRLSGVVVKRGSTVLLSVNLKKQGISLVRRNLRRNMIYPVGKLYWKFSIEFPFGFLLTTHGGNLLFL